MFCLLMSFILLLSIFQLSIFVSFLFLIYFSFSLLVVILIINFQKLISLILTYRHLLLIVEYRYFHYTFSQELSVIDIFRLLFFFQFSKFFGFLVSVFRLMIFIYFSWKLSFQLWYTLPFLNRCFDYMYINLFTFLVSIFSEYRLYEFSMIHIWKFFCHPNFAYQVYWFQTLGILHLEISDDIAFQILQVSGMNILSNVFCLVFLHYLCPIGNKREDIDKGRFEGNERRISHKASGMNYYKKTDMLCSSYIFTRWVLDPSDVLVRVPVFWTLETSMFLGEWNFGSNEYTGSL